MTIHVSRMGHFTPSSMPSQQPKVRFDVDLKWQHQAACRGTDVAMWFPAHSRGPAIRALKKICDQCPVRKFCAQEALNQETSKLPESGVVRAGVYISYAFKPHAGQVAARRQVIATLEKIALGLDKN